MKFDPPIPFLAPPAAGPEHAIRFTLEQGAFAGRAFTGTLYICPNPCCPCQTLRFCCQPDQEPGGLEPVAPADPPGPLRFELRVLRRALDPEAEMPPESLALARAVVAELQPADWEQWLRVFLATKRGQMATMDLDGPDAWLPPEIMDGSATMVGYVEVFPWAEELRFPLAGDTWEADDQYCVDPDCDCQTTILTFIRVPRNAKRQSRPVRSESVLRHDYVTGKTKVEERRFWGPEATELMAALRAAHPDCDLTFRGQDCHGD